MSAKSNDPSHASISPYSYTYHFFPGLLLTDVLLDPTNHTMSRLNHLKLTVKKYENIHPLE
jgi:hypothetical protein